jgi:ATP-dependent Clp protease ATP-binding subunit ClpA
MFERYTPFAKQIIVSARQKATQLGSSEIESRHILLALLGDEALVDRLHLNEGSINEIRGALSSASRSSETRTRAKEVPLGGDALRTLCLADDEAERLKNPEIGIEHLLIGLLRLEDSEVASLLFAKGLTLKNARSMVTAQVTQASAPQRLSQSRAASISERPDEEAVLLREIAKLVAKGRSRQAVKRIDQFITKPGNERAERIRRFAPHAAAIARAIGDLSLAQTYNERYSKESDESPESLYNMADVLDLLGNHDEAKKYAVRCYRMAAAGGSSLSEGFLELLEKRFPGVAGS